MIQNQPPHYLEKLIQEIESSLGKYTYSVGDSIELVAYKQGQQSVLDFLNKLRNK